MPEIVTTLHGLLEIHNTVPWRFDDCYLVGIWNRGTPEDAEGEEALWDTPWRASEFPPLRSAVSCDEDEKEDWNHQWGWDGEIGGRCRIGCNTESLLHPIHLRFRWGEGAPGHPSGIAVLPHEEMYAECDRPYCKHCGKQFSRAIVPEDCPTRRLVALAGAVLDGVAAEHVRAVSLWHDKQES